MKLDSKLMLKLLKEEYDKRITYYLGEVETKAKHSQEDGELIQNAHGLKVKDRAGNVFVIDKLEESESGEILVHLIPPGNEDSNLKIQTPSTPMNDAREDNLNQSYNSLEVNESEESEKEDKSKNDGKKRNPMKSGEIIKPNPKAKTKKSFSINSDAQNIESYEEVNGRVVITLKELDKDFTLWTN